MFADWLARSFGLNQVQYGDFPGGTVITNTPAHAGDTKDKGSIPGLRRAPGEFHRQEESGGLQSMGLQRLRPD